MQTRLRQSVGLLAVASAAVLFASGCVTEGPVRPEPKPVRRPPNDLRVERVLLASEAVIDRDRNGYSDTIPVRVQLFGDQNIYPTSVFAPGEFIFTLFDQAGEQRVQWRVPADVVARRREMVLGLATHRFLLDVRAGISDEMPAQRFALRARFEDERGGAAGTIQDLELVLGR
ncbi:MAG: hypothetical protein AAF747_00495 [Planctomycetota bacterium]